MNHPLSADPTCEEPHCVLCGEHGTPDRPLSVHVGAYFHDDCYADLKSDAAADGEEVRGTMFRDMEIVTYNGDSHDFAEDWKELHPDKQIAHITGCSFGFAEENIGLIQYTDDSYEVGIGESMRPYTLLYQGTSAKEAAEAFWKAVTDHVQ